MIGLPKTRDDFLKAFSSYKAQSWLDIFESQIQSYLNNSDFSSEKKEEWKYFPFQKVIKNDFVFQKGYKDPQELKSQISDSFLIRVKNGKAFPAFQKNKNISLFHWSDFLNGKVILEDSIKDKIIFALKRTKNNFCVLNNIFYPEGFILLIRDHLKKPLEIQYTHSSQIENQGLNLRNFIFVEKKAQVIETFFSRKEKKDLFLNIQTDCFLEEKAKLEYCFLDQTGDRDVLIHHLFSTLSKESKAYFFSLCLKARLSRWFKEVYHAEKSQSEIKGITLMNGNSHTDHKIIVNHQGKKGKSSQLYKSFLFDSAKHIFQGLVSIEKQAGESSARQLNKNYLFGSKAFAVAFPELDICPSDVKAEHGATVSPFSENKDLIFYLESRGIDPLLSVHLVLMSLLRETLFGLQNSSKNLIQKLISQKISSLENTFIK
ncbi:MAG: SufD family Fe-S cluster assembly protein [Bdellovibrionaceae bacterium]|nr:SufD family Fe-S cluster assembly protein [Pseudobdellovibrionaceae bacterium]